MFSDSTFTYKKAPLQWFGIFIIVGFSVGASMFAIVVLDGYTNTMPSEIKSFTECDSKLISNSGLNFRNMQIAGIAINMITDLVVSIMLSAQFDTFEFKSKKQKHKNELFMK